MDQIYNVLVEADSLGVGVITCMYYACGGPVKIETWLYNLEGGQKPALSALRMMLDLTCEGQNVNSPSISEMYMYMCIARKNISWPEV